MEGAETDEEGLKDVENVCGANELVDSFVPEATEATEAP